MRLIQSTFSALCLSLLLASAAGAQSLGTTDVTQADGVSVDRDSLELADRVNTPPEDVDFVDTAMIFTNTDGRSIVKCAARNANGKLIGRAWVALPNRGLRFLLASDIAGGTDFVGSVDCRSNGRVVGTALLLGPRGVTDLPSRRIQLDGPVGIAFPVVATR